MKKRGYDDQIFKQLTKITYTLKKDEDGMGLSIVSYSNNWPSSHTVWRRMIRKGRDNWTKFTYELETHEEDGIG